MATSPSPLEILAPLGKLDATDATVQAAVTMLVDQARALPAESIADLLWDTWVAVFEVAGQTPVDRQGKLVEFMVELQKVKVTGANGQPLKDENGGVVWTDLPTFGWVAREKWNFDPRNTFASESDRKTWENWTSFLAQLTARADPDHPQFDFTMYALWAIREALEEPDVGDPFATAHRLAAIWMRFCGKQIRQLSLDEQELPENCGAPGSKHKWWGFKGFSIDRWKLWQRELKGIGDRNEDAQKTLGIMQAWDLQLPEVVKVNKHEWWEVKD